MRKRIIIFSFLFVIFSLFGCNNNRQPDGFDGLIANITDAKGIGLSKLNTNDTSKKTIFTTVHASDNEYTLVKINDDDTVEEVTYQDEQSNRLDPDFYPVYVDSAGNYTVVLYVNDKLHERDSEGKILNFIEEIVNNASTSEYPLRELVAGHFLFSNSDYVDEIEFRDCVLLFIHNDTGKVFDLNKMMFEKNDPTLETNLYDLIVFEDTITLFTSEDEQLQAPVIQRLTYNYDENHLIKETYNSNLTPEMFFPLLTDQYNNTVFRFQSEIKVLNSEFLVNIIDNQFSVYDSVPVLIDSEIYFLSYDTDKGSFTVNKLNNKNEIEPILDVLIEKGSNIELILTELINVNVDNPIPKSYEFITYKNETTIYLIDRTGHILTLDTVNNSINLIQTTEGEPIDVLNRFIIQDSLFIIHTTGIKKVNLISFEQSDIISDELIDSNSIHFSNGYLTVQTVDGESVSKTSVFIEIKKGIVIIGEENMPEDDVILIESLN